jgi:type I restriction enzyme S subunit
MSRELVRDLVSRGVLRVEDGNHGNDRPRPDEFVPDGVAFIRAADMSSGVVDFSGAGKINDTAVRRIRKGVGAPGDVILSHKGTVGRVAVAPLDAPEYVCSPQTTFWRSLDQSVLDQRYLRCVLVSSDFQSQLAVFAGQTDMAPYVSLTDQRAMLIEVPPIDDQQAIAEVFTALDEKIVANGGTIATADALAEALTRRSFSGEAVRLADVASVTMGSSPPGSSYNEAEIGLPFYQGVRDFGVRFPSRRIWTDRPVRLAAAGDTLLSVRAPVGRTNLAEEEICIGRGLAALRAKDGGAMTLFHQVRAAHAAWAPYEAEGTVFGAINRAQLEGIELPTLMVGRAAELEVRLTQLENLIAGLLRESSALTRTRDELLPLLMSGKVRVKDAEKSLEEVL